MHCEPNARMSRFQDRGGFRDYLLLSASLESFHDVVDSRLSTRLVAKSAAFWQMVHSYGGLHEELADAMADIRKVRSVIPHDRFVI